MSNASATQVSKATVAAKNIVEPTDKPLVQSLYYGIGIVMMKGISLLMMPYVTRQLMPAEYGLLETLLVLADIGTIIIGFGLVEALYRFVAGESGQARERLIAHCLLLAAAVTLLGIVLLSVFSPWLLQQLPGNISSGQLWLIAIPTFAEGFIAIPLTLMRMQALARRFCLLNVVKAVVQALLVIILLEAGYGMDAILISGAVASLMMVGLLLRYQWQQSGLGQLKPSQLSAETVWRLTRYGGPIVLSRMGLFAITGLDRWLLADKAGVEQLGIYAIACKFALVLGLLMQPFALWWFPYRFRLLQQENGRQLCAHYALLGTNIGIFLAASMVMVLPPFILLVLPPEYHLAASVVIWLALINAVKNAGDLMNLGCFSGESSQTQMWVQWFCALLAVSGYLMFIPAYGIMAAVWVLAIVYLVRLLLFYLFSQHYLPLPYQHGQWGVAVLLSLALVLVSVRFATWLTPPAALVAGVALSLLLLVLLFISRIFPLEALRTRLRIAKCKAG